MGFVAQTKTRNSDSLLKNTRCFLQQHVFLVQVMCLKARKEVNMAG